jgi:hypothetical protein
MKAAFPPAPDPIQEIPMLQPLIEILFYMCCCTQTHWSPASTKMNLLLCTAKPDLYAFLCLKAYPATFSPFPPEVAKVLDYNACTNDMECTTPKATHTLNKKMQADIVMMNAALTNVFLDNSPPRSALPFI